MSDDWETDKARNFVMQDTGIYTVSSMPKLSKWQCHFTEGPYGLTLTVIEGKEPNWFHRKMQELCFGFKWRKGK